MAIFTTMKKAYYDKVARYYDSVSDHFDQRKNKNEFLEFIRADFRKHVDEIRPKKILEIGCGTGKDVCYFSAQDFTNEIIGIDVSPEMIGLSRDLIAQEKHTNCRVYLGTIEDLEEQLTGQKFDMIYVFYGALNTVENMENTTRIMKSLLDSDGHMVLTFVNKWYLLGILKPLLKFNFNIAFKRLRKVWGGYSPEQFLASKVYSPKMVYQYFGKKNLVKRKGYSILFPAWYEYHKYKDQKERNAKLWAWDQKINRTPFWSLGEYALYVFSKGKN